MTLTIVSTATLAVGALIAEAQLTPKPALVDRRGSGAHHDLTLALMLRSAQTLEPFFAQMEALARRHTGVQLREQLAHCGRQAERAMLTATGGVNTHRGAIWTLGLLIAAASRTASQNPMTICAAAASIAQLPDKFAPATNSHGQQARQRYGAQGARGEAQSGFPHILFYGLPTLWAARASGLDEDEARLSALLAIMQHLPDTCLLHRGGPHALATAQRGAAQCLALTGTARTHAIAALDADLLHLWASPGGSADLLAATLFLDALATQAQGDRS